MLQHNNRPERQSVMLKHNLQAKVTVVTGAGQRHLPRRVRCWGREGARLVLIDRNSEGLALYRQSWPPRASQTRLRRRWMLRIEKRCGRRSVRRRKILGRWICSSPVRALLT